MSLFGARNAAELGMKAQSHGLNLISQNVANTNTTGYKQTESQFKTMLERSTVSQDYFGVRASDRQLITKQGQIKTTGDPLDLAINGQGFFQVQQSLQAEETTTTMYTRDGAFSRGRAPDGDMYLKDSDGNFVMGREAPPEGAAPDAPTPDSLKPLSLTAVETIDAKPTTEVRLQENIPNKPAGENLQTGVGVVGPEGKRQTLGLIWSQNPDTANGWNLEVAPKGGTTNSINGNNTSTLPVTFGGNGELQTVDGQNTTSFDTTVTWGNGSQSTINLDLAGSTQLGEERQRVAVDDNGNLAGDLQRLEFDSQGVLHGNYTNGEQRRLYEIPVTDFNNPRGLEPQSGTTWQYTARAGERQVLTPQGINSRTGFVPSAVERSNVELEDQFTRMITTQKAYSSVASAYQTADEMTQTATQLKS